MTQWTNAAGSVDSCRFISTILQNTCLLSSLTDSFHSLSATIWLKLLVETVKLQSRGPRSRYSVAESCKTIFKVVHFSVQHLKVFRFPCNMHSYMVKKRKAHWFVWSPAEIVSVSLGLSANFPTFCHIVVRCSPVKLHLVGTAVWEKCSAASPCKWV